MKGNILKFGFEFSMVYLPLQKKKNSQGRMKHSEVMIICSLAWFQWQFHRCVHMSELIILYIKYVRVLVYQLYINKTVSKKELYSWISVFYPWKLHDIINQLYFNKKFLKNYRNWEWAQSWNYFFNLFLLQYSWFTMLC